MATLDDSPIARCTRYIEGVQRGTILVGDGVKLAVKRHLADLERAKKKDWPYYFDADGSRTNQRRLRRHPCRQSVTPLRMMCPGLRARADRLAPMMQIYGNDSEQWLLKADAAG